MFIFSTIWREELKSYHTRYYPTMLRNDSNLELKVALSTSTMDLSNLRDSYTPTSQSFRHSSQSITSIRKGVSAESLLDGIPTVDMSQPRVSFGAKRSLTRSNSNATIDEER